MSPHVKGSKQFISQSVTKSFLHDELMKKLKVDEEREKKRREKEAKRRADLEKMKQESLQMQASVIIETRNKRSSSQKKTIELNKNLACSDVTKAKEKSNKMKSNKHVVSSNNEHNSKHSYASDAKTNNYRKQSTNSSESKYNKGHYYQSSRRRNDSNSSYETIARQSRCSSSSESGWGNFKEDISVLSVEAPLPRVNVWSERIIKAEAIRALEPKNENDEETMFQQAIELSMMEAAAEESRRKFEEEYEFQMDVLKDNSEITINMAALNNNTSFNQSENGSPLPLYSSKEDMFTVENNSVANKKSNIFKNASTLNSSAGAKSKTTKNINKIVGDGILKYSSKNKVMQSETLSDFVNDVMEDKHTFEECIDIFSERNVTKTNIKFERSVPTSSSYEDILYVGKETNDDDNDNKNKSNTALFVEKHQSTSKKNIFINEETKNKTDKVETEADLQFSNAKCENKDPVTLESSEIKNALSDKCFEGVSNSTFNFNASENSYVHKTKDDTIEDSIGHETLKLPILGHLLDKSDNIQSVDLNIKTLEKSNSSLWTHEHTNTIKYDLKGKYHEVGNTVLGINSDSNTQAELSYNLPSKSPNIATSNNNIGNIIANENAVSDAKLETNVSPPQFLPPVQPQFSFMHPMLPPGIFPGMDVNPYLLGYGGMSPIMLQQMLMFRNPYFANQLLPMEEFYKAYRMPTNMQSSTLPCPIVAGNSNLQSNLLANSNNLPGANSQLQSQLSANPSNYQEENTKSVKLTELNTTTEQLNTSNADIDNFKFKNYFSDISFAIPPPKPCENNLEISVSTSSKSSQPKKLSTWSDSEDENYNSKVRNRRYDDGWNDYNAQPIKTIKEQRSKRLRQPTSQPQMSHYWQKKT